MRILTMNGRYPIRMQYLDSGNTTNFTNPAPAVSPAGVGTGPPKANAFSPAVVAVIGVLAGAFLIISYYRIFLKYCNSHHLSIWGTRSDGRNGGPSTIVLMEEHAWPAEAAGLDEALISRIPTCKYSAGEGIVDGTECSVCLGEFEEGEELRILPKCNHPFHIPCIDTWLAASSTCPLCRVNIVLAVAVPYALLPLEREPPAVVPRSHGPTVSFIPLAAPANPMQALITHEIEILQEQHVQEFLEAGQLSGPSSRGSSLLSSAPDVGTPENHGIEMPITQHMRDLSLETPSVREIHTVNDPVVERPVSVPKQSRLYSRARSSRSHKGKHPLSSPQTKPSFARLLAGPSRSTGSSSMNQVVVELLAQEIFQNNNNIGTDPGGGTPENFKTTLETRVRSAREASTSSSTASSRRGPARMRHDNASFELMWSIDEQENPLMWSVNEEPQKKHSDSSSEDEMEDLAERLADAMELRSNPPDSDSEDHNYVQSCSRRSVSFKRSNSSCSLGTWSSKRHSFKHSMAKLKRYGSSVSFRQNSFRRSDKVHASDPVFEMFEVD